LGDVVEESDGDLMGDGVNIAARLEGIAKPGAICLSEDAYRQVKSRLDLAVSDLGATQLKNIAEPVRVYSLEVGKSAQSKPIKSAKQRSRSVLLGAVLVALIVIGGGTWYFLGATRTGSVASKPTAAEAAHLSIVVLPFTNLSGDPNQDYFADGITENLTTDLSRIRNSFVIARNTAFTFKGKNISVKEVSKALSVRYVLEGSIQRDQNRVRVNAQLIDGDTGAHLWADRFEEGTTDLFKLQDQVVARLANTLGYELTKAEAQKSMHSTNPDVVDLMMRGWAALWQPPTEERTETARDYFERAMKIDPQSAEAMVGFAYARSRSIAYVGQDIVAIFAALDLVAKAIAIDPGYAFAYYVKSTLLLSLALYDPSRWPEVIEAAQTTVTLDPNAAYGYQVLGLAEGRPDAASKGLHILNRPSP
jgi:TolB-like protein